MKEIPLRNSPLMAIVDDEDFESCMARGWCLDTDGYVVSTSLPRARLHVSVYGRKYLDHKNGNKLDCQKGNLRPASASQNGANRKRGKNNSSGYKGVDWNNGQWRVRLAVATNRLYLGHFRDVIDAAKAYDMAAKQHFGEFAKTNFESA